MVDRNSGSASSPYQKIASDGAMREASSIGCTEPFFFAPVFSVAIPVPLFGRAAASPNKAAK